MKEDSVVAYPVKSGRLDASSSLRSAMSAQSAKWWSRQSNFGEIALRTNGRAT